MPREAVEAAAGTGVDALVVGPDLVVFLRVPVDFVVPDGFVEDFPVDPDVEAGAFLGLEVPAEALAVDPGPDISVVAAAGGGFSFSVAAPGASRPVSTIFG